MAEEPGFFSYENFPYPMLALGQTIPRGYQYQSQMTPYKRDARGDWGRALNESIDQFFGMWPQYMQQRRQFALQRDQLSRQRLADQHQAKLRPFELKEAQTKQQLTENRMQMLKNYPAMVKSLPIPEKIKGHLLTLPPTEGLKMMQGFMTQMMKPRTKMIPAGQPTSDGQTFSVDVQQKDDGTLIKSPITPKKITIQPKGVIPNSGGKINTYNVPLELNPADNSLSFPLEKPHTEVITLPVGDSGNPYNVPVEYNPKTKEWSFPLERPHIELTTVQPGEDFPDGTKNNTKRPIQYDKKTNRRIAYEGTAPPKKIERATKDHPQVVALSNQFGADYVAKMLPFLTVDKTYSETGELQWPKGMEALNKDLQLKSIAAKAPTPSQLFQEKHAASNYANVLSYADLAEVAGNRIESQKKFCSYKLT